MKVKRFFLLAILIIGSNMCFGQGNTAWKEPESSMFISPRIRTPLYVLKIDDQTLELDRDHHETLDFESFDTKWIKSIRVIKGEEAKNTYGDKGLSGVVVIEFKESYILPKDLRAKFKQIK